MLHEGEVDISQPRNSQSEEVPLETAEQKELNAAALADDDREPSPDAA